MYPTFPRENNVAEVNTLSLLYEKTINKEKLYRSYATQS
jgi:hypothetical protein